MGYSSSPWFCSSMLCRNADYVAGKERMAVQQDSWGCPAWSQPSAVR